MLAGLVGYGRGSAEDGRLTGLRGRSGVVGHPRRAGLAPPRPAPGPARQNFGPNAVAACPVPPGFGPALYAADRLVPGTEAAGILPRLEAYGRRCAARVRGSGGRRFPASVVGRGASSRLGPFPGLLDRRLVAGRPLHPPTGPTPRRANPPVVVPVDTGRTEVLSAGVTKPRCLPVAAPPAPSPGYPEAHDVAGGAVPPALPARCSGAGRGGTPRTAGGWLARSLVGAFAGSLVGRCRGSAVRGLDRSLEGWGVTVAGVRQGRVDAGVLGEVVGIGVRDGSVSPPRLYACCVAAPAPLPVPHQVGRLRRFP